MECSVSQRKGKVPAHIQPKQFQHPGINSPCVLILNHFRYNKENKTLGPANGHERDARML